jgi:hypothetical protein
MGTGINYSPGHVPESSYIKKYPLFHMQDQPGTGEDRQAAAKKLLLVLAITDGTLVLLMIAIPLVLLGVDAYTDRIGYYLIPFVLCNVISGTWFAYNILSLQPSG